MPSARGVHPTDSGEPVKRGSGWVEPQGLGPPPGVELCDRLVDAQDQHDRAELAERLRKSAPST